jgi:hypothetical protein
VRWALISIIAVMLFVSCVGNTKTYEYQLINVNCDDEMYITIDFWCFDEFTQEGNRKGFKIKLTDGSGTINVNENCDFSGIERPSEIELIEIPSWHDSPGEKCIIYAFQPVRIPKNGKKYTFIPGKNVSFYYSFYLLDGKVITILSRDPEILLPDIELMKNGKHPFEIYEEPEDGDYDTLTSMFAKIPEDGGEMYVIDHSMQEYLKYYKENLSYYIGGYIVNDELKRSYIYLESS